MQKLPKNRIQYSLKDLLKFNDSQFNSFMDRYHTQLNLLRKEIEVSPTMKWVQESGNFFEIIRLDKYKKDLMKQDVIKASKIDAALITELFKTYTLNTLISNKIENYKRTNEEGVEEIPQTITTNWDKIQELSVFIRKEMENFKDFSDQKSIFKEKNPQLLEEKLQKAHEETLLAMKHGYKLILQGLLRGKDFMGSPDLLVRVNDTAPYKYEVKDIKRSHTSKAKFVLQICAYSDLLQEVQGELPECGEILLGNNTSEKFKINDFFNYYKKLKENFVHFHTNFNHENQQKPDRKDLTGDYKELAKDQLNELIDSIANISNDEILKLQEEGIFKKEQLRNITSVTGIPESALHRIKTQSFISSPFEVLKQFKGESSNLYDLPSFNDNDIYLDIKTSESLDKDKILFFFNIYFLDENKQWKHEVVEAPHLGLEEPRFKHFLSIITPIIEKYKADEKYGKIYHFNRNVYQELLACASKYNKGYYSLTNWFKRKVFICLQDFLINSVALNVEEYSLENIAKVLNFNLDCLGIGFEAPLVSLKEHKKSHYDHEIKDDVASSLQNLALDKIKFIQKIHEWMLNLSKDNNIEFIPFEEREEYKVVVRKEQERINEFKEKVIKNIEAKKVLEEKINKETKPEKKQKLIKEKEEEEEILKREEEIEKRNKELKEAYVFEAKEYDSHDEKKRLIILNLQCQDFNRRERDLKDLETSQLNNGTKTLTLKNLRCLTDIELVSVDINRTAKSERSHFALAKYKYNYFEDHRIQVKDNVIIKNNPQFGSINVFSLDDSFITLRFGSKDLNEVEKHKISTIIENKPNLSSGVNNFIKEKNAFLSETHPTLNLPKCYYDFLTRSYPDIIGIEKGSPLYNENDNLTEVAKKIIPNLNNSCLIIQGPPGVGKSYTAAHSIKELLKKGKSVIISSNSNKAIDGLLISVAKECKDLGINFYKHSSENELSPELVECGIKNCHEKHREEELPSVYVIGTTVFGAYKYKADYLFVDEAGQVSIANLAVMSAVVNNIVLIGDQNQLEQPIQGIHPGESGDSALQYFLKNTEGEEIRVIPSNKGLFLPITRRMNSELCSVVSKYFYENKLKSIEDVSGEKIKTQIDTSNCKIVNKNKGVQFINVHHKNNTQYSIDEINKIKDVVDDLIGCPMIDEKGISRTIQKDDIIIVSPFNLQVSKLKKVLPDYKIGSVDLFQGQEAAIVIYSLAASDAGGRGLGFLLNPNRTNVALSRGKALAIFIASEDLLNIPTEKIEDLKLLNMLTEISFLK
jgi:predicted RecB family nuclease